MKNLLLFLVHLLTSISINSQMKMKKLKNANINSTNKYSMFMKKYNGKNTIQRKYLSKQ